MPKFKVTKSFMYTGTTTISAPNLQTAETMAEEPDFKADLNAWKDDGSEAIGLISAWVNSITQQENDDD